jgi:cytoskeletal protein RodZ
MAQQLSRPFQIALAAVVLLALVWFVALRGHSTSSTTPVASTQAGAAAAPTTRSSASASAAATPKSATRAAVKPHTVKPHVNKTAVDRDSGIPAQQAAVESELKQGKVVAVLFWNPKGADDMAVRKELQAVGKKLGGKIAVHTAEANQVGSYGSITRAIQVYQTPTILFVNSKGLTTTLTGFTDAFSIEQTIDEARQA